MNIGQPKTLENMTADELRGFVLQLQQDRTQLMQANQRMDAALTEYRRLDSRMHALSLATQFHAARGDKSEASDVIALAEAGVSFLTAADPNRTTH